MGEKPINFRLGRVRASVWSNESENGPWYSVSFSRLYKDKDGQWQDSTRFSREDLPLLMKAADQVHTFLYRQQTEETAGDEPGSDRSPDPYDATPPLQSR
jgi:hypothetical protein